MARCEKLHLDVYNTHLLPAKQQRIKRNSSEIKDHTGIGSFLWTLSPYSGNTPGSPKHNHGYWELRSHASGTRPASDPASSKYMPTYIHVYIMRAEFMGGEGGEGTDYSKLQPLPLFHQGQSLVLSSVYFYNPYFHGRRRKTFFIATFIDEVFFLSFKLKIIVS